MTRMADSDIPQLDAAPPGRLPGALGRRGRARAARRGPRPRVIAGAARADPGRAGPD
jgi:hypothetical protein